MFDHVTIRGSDRARPERFYGDLLAVPSRSRPSTGPRSKPGTATYVLDPDGHNIELVNHNR